MWLMTTQGFYSVVEKKDNPDMLVVRARVRDDLKALERQLPGQIKIYEGIGTDYPFRIFIDRAHWEKAVREITEDISYTNFKNAVKERQGRKRANLYERLWGILWGLTPHRHPRMRRLS